MPNKICNLTDKIFDFIKKIFISVPKVKILNTKVYTWSEANLLLKKYPNKFRISSLEDTNRVTGIVFLDEIEELELTDDKR